MATASSASLIKTKSLGNGPKLAFHTGCVIGTFMYIHGGIDKKGSTTPLNGLYKMDLESGQWTNLTSDKSPFLSHHASVNLNERYYLLIGGWNGKARVSDLFVYDTEGNKWLQPKTSGFPVGAGLSSHTASVLANGDILVIGREGSLRMQRRSGNAFMLKGDVQKGQFTYSEYPMGVASRSGHSTHILANTVYTYGGRSDKILEMHGGYKGHEHAATIVKRAIEQVGKTTSMGKPPCGRKHHVSLSGAGGIIIHGGETFDGRSREPVGDVYLLMIKPNVCWFNLGKTEQGRAGHVCAAYGSGMVIHGGETGKSLVCSDAILLEI